MLQIPISSIEVPTRIRKIFDAEALIALADSIAEDGLLHPIVVSFSSDSHVYKLIAGERRLRAIKILHQRGFRLSLTYQDEAGKEIKKAFLQPDHVPAHLIPIRDEAEALRAELNENIKRVDITWQERADTEAKLYDLMGGTQRDFSAETGIHETEVHNSILLSKRLDDPEISSCKDRTEALKKLSRKASREAAGTLASLIENPTSMSSVTCGDSFELLPNLEPKYDCILADPPYGIDADKFGSLCIKHNYNDSKDFSRACYELIAQEGYRIAKPKACAYIFCDINNYYHVTSIMLLHGWTVWPRPLIWYKGTSGKCPKPDHGPRYCYEAILYATKGGMKLQKPGLCDVILDTSIGGDYDLKPPSLLENLLGRSLLSGARIIDPFCGHGSSVEAAQNLSMHIDAIEVDKTAADYAKSRLK